MAYYAKIDVNGTVTAVHTIHNNELLLNGIEVEEKGAEFLTSLYGAATWIKTSYNGNIRKNYAGIGFTYDATRDAFIPPQPFASWVLVEDTCQWTAPVAMPDDGSRYTWDEATTSWIEVV